MRALLLLQDPSVLHASSPSAPPALDPSHAAGAAMPPPPVISPKAGQFGAGQQQGYGSPSTAASPAHHANLMDEIGNSYVSFSLKKIENDGRVYTADA